MSFGENLIFLRKMRNQMSQEELAEKMEVSRQTVSKWELNSSYPEIEKIIKLCSIFSCTMDELIQTDMNVCEEAFMNIREEYLDSLQYIQYALISNDPESDAEMHVRKIAKNLGIENPQVIGWDFPFVSQEQINVFHMHGYVSALILPNDLNDKLPDNMGIIKQPRQKYAAITIKNPFIAPFKIIPNAYKTLLSHIKINQLSSKKPENVISCFEKVYEKDKVTYMDVYIAIENK